MKLLGVFFSIQGSIGWIKGLVESLSDTWSTSILLRDLLVNLTAAIIAVLGGVFLPVIASYISAKRRHFRRLFGVGPFRTRMITVTLDTYLDSRRLTPPRLNAEKDEGFEGRFYKPFPDGHVAVFPGASGDILGYCSARAAAHLIEGLSGIASIHIRAISDNDVASDWNGTFINLGCSASNIKTDHIKHLPENHWLREDINGKFEFKDGQTAEMEGRYDKGIIMKVTNPYFAGHALFICAGLGEWGTSGAAWFLATKWRHLSKRFGDNSFLIVVSVAKGSDQSAREINAFGTEVVTSRVRRWIRRSKQNTAA